MKNKYMAMLLGSCLISLSAKAVEYEYNANGILSKLTYDSGGYVLYDYDVATGKIQTETYYYNDGTKGYKTDYNYNSDNSYNAIKTSYYSGGSKVGQIARVDGKYYNEKGELETEWDPYGSYTRDYYYTHNADGSIATRRDSMSAEEWTYTYNTDGTLAYETSENKKKVYTYNGNGILQMTEFYDNKILFGRDNYDSNGIYISAEDHEDRATDANGNITHDYISFIGDPYGGGIGLGDIYYTYYANNQKESEEINLYTVDGAENGYEYREWNKNGQLTYEAVDIYENGEYAGWTVKDIEYDENGNLIKETFNQYDDAGDKISETISKYDSLGYRTVYQDGKKIGMFDKNGNPYQRRIYTVEEATRLSKPTGNTFRLRYK
ncbi:MAG: hypothetical protein IJ870_01975 [Alphaproteobacteria bacterium]|nr:hypothetical protein [Alphaproteobacteria bacterium]